MSQFVQVGNRAVNMSLVAVIDIDREKGRVDIYIAGDEQNALPYTFINEEASMFIRWWDKNADIFLCT